MFGPTGGYSGPGSSHEHQCVQLPTSCVAALYAMSAASSTARAHNVALCLQGGGPYGREVTRGQDLTGRDFSGLDLTGQDFKTVRLLSRSLSGMQVQQRVPNPWQIATGHLEHQGLPVQDCTSLVELNVALPPALYVFPTVHPPPS